MAVYLSGAERRVLFRVLSFPIVFCLSSAVSAGNDIEIVSGSASVNMDAGNVSTDDNAQIGIVDLFADGAPSRIVTTGSGGANTQQGDILLSGDIDFNRSNLTGKDWLRLHALNDIVLDGRVYDGLASNDRFDLQLYADSDALGGGNVYLNSSIGRGLRTYIGSGSLFIGSTGAYALMSGQDSLYVDSIDNSQGGGFQFSAGSLTLRNSGLTIDTAGLLSDSVNISSAKSLSLLNDHVIALGSGSSLALTGGALRAGQVDNSAGGTVSFSSGNLALTNSGLDISTTGLLGDNLSLGASSAVSVSDALTIGATGTVDLNGGFLTAGSIDNSAGGNFNFTSGYLTLTNSDVTVGPGGLMGSTLALNGNRSLILDNNQLIIGATGAVSLDGGLLTVSSIDNSSGGSFNFNSGDLRLTNSDLTVGPGGLLPNLSLTANRNVFVDVNRQLVISGGGSVDLSGGNLATGGIDTTGGGTFIFNSGNLTLTNSGLDVDETGMLGAALSIANGKNLSVNGLTIGNGTGATDTLDQTGGVVTVRSPGSLLVDAGGAYNLSGGTLYVNNSSSSITVNGSFTHTGGTVRGSSSFSGSTVSLVLGAGGVYELDGGYLRASTIDRSGGGSFLYTSGTLQTWESITVDSGGLLGDNVSLTAGKVVDAGNLSIGAGGSLVLDGGGLFVGSIDNSAGGTFSYLSGDLSTTDSVSIGSGGLLGGAVTLNAGDDLNLGGLHIAGGGTLTLDGGSVFASNVTSSGTLNFNSGTLTMGNQLVIGSAGVLGANPVLGAGRNLVAVNGMDITSGSSLRLNGGSLSVGPISNSGTFTFQKGHLDLVNQNLTVGTGGLLGQNVSLGAGKSLNVDSSPSSSLVVAADGTLDITDTWVNARSVNNANRIRLHGYGQLDAYSLTNDSSIKLNDTSRLDVNSGLMDNNGSFTVSSGAVVNLQNTSNPGGAEYIQYSGTTVVDGTMNVDGAVKINGGTLSGSGVLNADLVINPDGTLSPGNSPGQLQVNGDFTLASGAIMVVEIESDGLGGYLFDELFVTGSFDLQGQIRFSLLNGVDESVFSTDFDIGDFFQAGSIGSASPVTDTSLFDTVQILAASGNNWFAVDFAADGSFTTTPTVAPVPVPAAAWLFASGVLGLLGRARRRPAA